MREGPNLIAARHRSKSDGERSWRWFPELGDWTVQKEKTCAEIQKNQRFPPCQGQANAEQAADAWAGHH